MMLTVNLDVSVGLVNGAIGVSKSFMIKNGRVEIIYVKFKDIVCTQSICLHSSNAELTGTVGIKRHESKYLPKFKSTWR